MRRLFFNDWSPKVDKASGDATYTATYTEMLIYYTVKFVGGGTTPEQKVPYGGKVTKPTAPTTDGYTFNGWYKDPACTDDWDFANDKVTKETSLYAKWTIKSYNVSFDLQGRGDPKPDDQTINHGSKVTQPTAPTAEGYTFGGWYKDKECTDDWNFANDKVTTETTLYAKWTIKSYKVVFDLNGRGDPNPADQTINHGSKVTPPAPPAADGYTFSGWYKDKACTDKWNFSSDTLTLPMDKSRGFLVR